MHTKESLRAALLSTHQRLIDLVCSLTDEQRNVPYHPGINPPVWELGHAAFFYEVFVLRRLDNSAALMPGFDSIWDSFDIDHKNRWKEGVVPSLESTLAYSNEVIERVLNRIDNRAWSEDAHYLYRYAVHHEQMHIESQIWCRQTLGYPAPFGVVPNNPVQSPDQALDALIPEGDYRIGKLPDDLNKATLGFAFDAEKPGRVVHLAPFLIAKRSVSQGDFLAFVEAGGYDNLDYWSYGGKNWLLQYRDQDKDIAKQARTSVPGPIYWACHNGKWSRRWFDQWLPLNPAHPLLNISYWEAEAYCAWAKRRLPTEAEWEAATLNATLDGPAPCYPWGDSIADCQGDLDAEALGTNSVDADDFGKNPFGLKQTIGTAWEWTSDQFLPYDGFTMDMYPYMSTLQFGYHKVTKGGSCATSRSLIRGTYRQAYLPFRRDVFTGFRTCSLEQI